MVALQPGKRRIVASPGAWLVWGAVAFFLVNLAGVVGSVLVSSFGTRWFGTWLPEGFTTNWYADAWRSFGLLDVVIVTLQVSLLVVLIFETVLAFTTFDLIFAMTGGGPANATTFIAWHAYNEIFTNLNLGRGAALGLFIAALTLVAALAYWRALRTEDIYATR
jgi:ABC-type spermidine/putrescine transport system permease subunit I